MLRIGMMIAMTGLVACGGESTTTATDGSLGAEGYPSDFMTGKHRASVLALNEQDDGADFDEDGAGDNNLPFVLDTADQLLRDQDLAPEAFDEQIATSIADGSLNVLFDSGYADGELRVAVMNGLRDEESQALTIDPTSLLPSGEPATVFTGTFSDNTSFSVGAERAVLIVPFVPGEPPSAVPLERVTLSGTLSGETINGTLVGLIPSQELADDVLIGLIPEEGVGNLSKEALSNTVKRLAELDTIADIDMGDGRRAVSCAFKVEGTVETWAE